MVSYVHSAGDVRGEALIHELTGALKTNGDFNTVSSDHKGGSVHNISVDQGTGLIQIMRSTSVYPLYCTTNVGCTTLVQTLVTAPNCLKATPDLLPWNLHLRL